MNDENPKLLPVSEEETRVSATRAAWRVAPVWAGAIVFVANAIPLVGRSGSGIVAGPWQELAARAGSVYDRPTLTAWLAEACATLVPASALATLNLLNGLFGAFCCALVAVLAATRTKEQASGPVQILCGCVAGFLFAFTGAWQSIMEGFSPSTLTVALAIGGFLCIQRPERAISLGLVFGSALFVGLATANNPAFGVIALLLAVLAISAAAERYSAHSIVLVFASGFVIAASIPFVSALTKGEGVAGFLMHALSTPYPTIGDGVPRFGYLPRLTREFPWPTLLAAAGGLVLLIGKGPSRKTLGWALVFLCMGPFLPFLTNQTEAAGVITDPRAAEAMVLVSVSLFAAWGLVVLTRLLVPSESMRVRREVLLGLCGLVLAGYQWWSLPPPTGGGAEDLAKAVLSDCPRDAILVTGGARIHSLLSTAQAVRGIRPDVTVLPADALESPRLRQQLVETGLPDVALNPTFPPIDALERWSSERPQAVNALNESQRLFPSLRDDLRELAVWELVRDNFLTRPICFAGVSAPWLTARVQRNGVVLVFPRTGGTSQASFEYIANHVQGLRGDFRDSELHRTMVDLLLPLSDAARRQGDLVLAAQSADLACRIAGSNPKPFLASARAAARSGNREQAIAFVEDYLWLHPEPEPRLNLTETIQEELTRYALAKNYEASLGDTARDVDLGDRDTIAAGLWALDELEVLARGYRRNRERYIGQGDVDAVCDGAAVYAQLGELAAARAELGKAVSLDATRVWRRLEMDPRFSLLRIESSPAEAVRS